MKSTSTASPNQARARVLAAAVAAALVALGSQRSAEADDSPDRAGQLAPRQAYKAAGERARAGAYDEALDLIEATLAAHANSRPLLRLRGELLLEIRDFEGALAAYQAYLDAGPRGGNRRKAQRIVRDLQVVESTVLEVKIGNGPADIYLDSKTLGKQCVADPVCVRGMLPGRYRLFVEREGFEPIIERVDISLGETTTLERTLVEKPSELTIALQPEDAEVRVNDEVVGVGPQQLMVEAGTHVVTASFEGFAEATRRIEARAGEPVEIEVALAELVPLELAPAGAVLLLDGEEAEIVEGSLVLPPSDGERELVARSDGFEEATVTIAADRARGEPIRIALEPIPEPIAPPGPSGERMAAAAGFAAIGAAGLAAAGGFALHARSRWNASTAHCDGEVRCDERGFLLVRSAQTSAHRADVALATAGAATAVGAALWFLPEEELGRGRRLTVAGLGASGILSFAIAGGFGLEANARWDAAQPFCDVRMRCSEEGVAEVAEAKVAARRGNAMALVGGVLTAAALGVWLYPASDEAPPAASVSAGPAADGRGAGITISGAF